MHSRELERRGIFFPTLSFPELSRGPTGGRICERAARHAHDDRWRGDCHGDDTVDHRNPERITRPLRGDIGDGERPFGRRAGASDREPIVERDGWPDYNRHVWPVSA